MKFLLTGMNGTVAPVVTDRLRQDGHEVIAWDRATLPNATRGEVAKVIEAVKPDAMMHFAMGATDWAEWMALECRDRGLRFLHTSSVSVYGSKQVGPFTVDDEPLPDDDYGRYKLEGERKVLAANPDAAAYRIGWQIGTAPGNNNMIDYFARQMAEHGVIRASTRWVPASSHLSDTAECLVRHFLAGDRGLFHVDGNPGLNMFEIATLMRDRLGMKWKIEATDDFVRDHRMTDARIKIGSLAG